VRIEALPARTRLVAGWTDPDRRPRWLTPAALAVAIAAAASFIFLSGRDLIFYVDEWDFMLHRRGYGPDTFLPEQNGHLMAVPILVVKAQLETFGATSYVPYRLVHVAVVLACAGLFFVLVRRRVGTRWRSPAPWWCCSSAPGGSR
jgi:hypothetical protein